MLAAYVIRFSCGGGHTHAGLDLGGVLGPLVDQVGQILTGTVNGTLETAANITGWTGTNTTGTNTTAPTDPCTWTGITCNALGSITGLYMPTTRPHCPTATLSPSHAHLHRCSVLDGLALTGAIPSGLDALANLTTLCVVTPNTNTRSVIRLTV